MRSSLPANFDALAGRLANHIRVSARTVAATSEAKGWGELLTLDKGVFGGIKDFIVGGNVSRLTERGELVRVYFNFGNSTRLSSALASALRMEIEPYIVGVGQVAVRETEYGIIILRSELGGASRDKEGKA